MKQPTSFRDLEQTDPELAAWVKMVWFDAHADDILALSRDVDTLRPSVLRDGLRPLDGDFDALWKRLWAENHTAPVGPL